MKIYSFWSGDTTYFTKSSSLKKAQKIGKENILSYIKTCEYLGDKPEAEENYFIPEEIEKVTKKEFNYLIRVNPDTFILDDELYKELTI